MALPGKELHQQHDEYGPIFVYEEGEKRYLAFAPNDEQSCWSKLEPLVPQHDYIRCMLLVLIWADPKKIISLGLGAGMLNSVLHHRFPSCKQNVVELRAAVVDIAYRYFQLPQGKRIKIHTEDALAYLQHSDCKKVDVLFSDIYKADGVDDVQLSQAYLELCQSRLKPGGWLVLNCWKDHQNSDVLQRLSQLFSQLYSCATSSGNWVIFACNQPHRMSKSQERQRLKSLNQQLEFSLMHYWNRLQEH